MQAADASLPSRGKIEAIRSALVTPWIGWVGLLAVCTAFIQGGLDNRMA